MRIEPRFLLPHLHQAAIEQLAARLRDEGYKVSHEVPAETLPDRRAQFDLLAQRGDERVFYEVKVLGEQGRPDGSLRDLAAAARRHGGSFKLLLVRPEQGAEVNVSGLEPALARAIAGRSATLLSGLGPLATVEEVVGVEIGRVGLRPGGGTAIAGDAVLRLVQGTDRSALPFAFDVTLDGDGAVAADPPPHFALDFDAWDGWAATA